MISWNKVKPGDIIRLAPVTNPSSFSKNIYVAGERQDDRLMLTSFETQFSHAYSLSWLAEGWYVDYAGIADIEQVVGNDHKRLVSLVNAGKVSDLGKEKLTWQPNTAKSSNGANSSSAINSPRKLTRR